MKRVAGPGEAGVMADVHVQEVAGAGPLVAAGGLAWRPRRRARGRARASTFEIVEWGWPVRSGSTAAAPNRCAAWRRRSRRCSLAGSSRGITPRPARAIEQASECATRSSHARLPPALRPSGKTVAGETLKADRAPPAATIPCSHRLHEREAPGQSELGVTVKLHPGLLPESESSTDPQPRRRPGCTSQPFTTSVGTSASRSAPSRARDREVASAGVRSQRVSAHRVPTT